jgi:hypothetical protein
LLLALLVLLVPLVPLVLVVPLLLSAAPALPEPVLVEESFDPEEPALPSPPERLSVR